MSIAAHVLFDVVCWVLAMGRALYQTLRAKLQARVKTELFENAWSTALGEWQQLVMQAPGKAHAPHRMPQIIEQHQRQCQTNFAHKPDDPKDSNLSVDF